MTEDCLFPRAPAGRICTGAASTRTPTVTSAYTTLNVPEILDIIMLKLQVPRQMGMDLDRKKIV